MNLPTDKSLKGLRDRALLATLLYHGLRREELCRLKIKDIHRRRDDRQRPTRPRVEILYRSPGRRLGRQIAWSKYTSTRAMARECP
jgi:integrase